ncbi:MAG: hypothetical protein JW904_15130 [Spirochaetales bacterium]|nr:hypothetical protein [Spirochaetales bacterium]
MQRHPPYISILSGSEWILLDISFTAKNDYWAHDKDRTYFTGRQLRKTFLLSTHITAGIATDTFSGKFQLNNNGINSLHPE